MKISHMQTSFIGVYANVSISTLHCNLTNHCSATSIIGINYSTCYSKIIISRRQGLGYNPVLCLSYC